MSEEYKGFGLCYPKKEGNPVHPFDIDGDMTEKQERKQYLGWKSSMLEMGINIDKDLRHLVMREYELKG